MSYDTRVPRADLGMSTPTTPKNWFKALNETSPALPTQMTSALSYNC